MAITLVTVIVIPIVVPLKTYLLYLPAMQLVQEAMDDAPTALINTYSDDEAHAHKRATYIRENRRA